MIRVLLVDDQALVRSGFRVILESQADIEVVGEASDGAEALELAVRLTPDVICMDIEMPKMNGIEAARRILAEALPATDDAGRGSSPTQRTAILILTTFGHEQYLFDALAAGVNGFLLKTSKAEQLIDAVRTLAAGDALLGPDVTRAVMQRAAELSAAPAKTATAPTGTGAASPHRLLRNESAMQAAGLTEREREVLRLLAEGRSNGEVAAELFLGEATVKTHVSNLLQKIGARDRVQLVVWAHTVGAA